jgi:hypothetical protein
MEPLPPAAPNPAASPVPASVDTALPGLGELMSSATGIVINSPGVFLAIWAATGLPAFAITTAAALATGLTTKEAYQAAIDAQRWDQLGMTFAVGVVGLILTQFGSVAAIIAAAEGAAGRDPNAGDALERALGRFPAVLWTELVVGLRVLLGLLLLIVPGIILAIRYGFAQFVAVLETESGGAAARRSRDLVVPHMGKVVGNTLAMILLVAVAAFSIGVAGAVVQGLAQAFTGIAGSLAVQALIRGIVSLMSAWMIAGLVCLYAAIAARTPRGA